MEVHNVRANFEVEESNNQGGFSNLRGVEDINLEVEAKNENLKTKESWYLNLFNEVVLDFEYFDLK